LPGSARDRSPLPQQLGGEFDLGITQAYLRQNLFDSRFQYAVGKLFAPNFVNAYPFFDDNRQFLNQNFTTSPMIPVPLRALVLPARSILPKTTFTFGRDVHTVH
jgi:hypothetical protein